MPFLPALPSKLTTYNDAFENPRDRIYLPGKVSSVPNVYGSKDTIVRKKRRPPDFYSTKTKHAANLTEYKKPVKFDLMFKSKDIIRTDPNALPKPIICDKVDKLKESVRRSRPRLAMTPAVPLDDVEDQAKRDVLIANMYTTTSLRSAQEVQGRKTAVKAPLPERMAPSMPVFLPKLKLRKIDEEWRWDAMFSDVLRLRGHCEVDKEFWTRFKPRG